MAEFENSEPAFKCNTCKAVFASTEKIKEHYRSDWHVLNSKRRASGLFPLKRNEFKALVQQNSEPVPAPKQEPKSPVKTDNEESENVAESPSKAEEAQEIKAPPEPPKIGPTISIFDDVEFETTDECVQYMATKFGFFIPDMEYLADLDGMLEYLGEKVKLGGYCLYCQKIIGPGRPCQNHMISKSHCKIRYEEGVDGEEFEDFYDFSASYEDCEDVEVDEDGNVIEGGITVASTGELVLADGRILGHRDYRKYYKQYYRPQDNREPVLAAQREELLRLSNKFGGMACGNEEVAKMEDTQIMSLLVKYQKEARKGMVIEQRQQLKKDGRNQQLEYKSKIQKMRSSEVTTAKIRDYHGMLK